MITTEMNLESILQGAINKYSGSGPGIKWPMEGKKLIVAPCPHAMGGNASAGGEPSPAVKHHSANAWRLAVPTH